MKKLTLLLPLIVAFSSCKKEDKTNNDRILIHSFCKECTITIKFASGKVVSEKFKENFNLDERYTEVMPFTGSIIPHDNSGGLILSSSIRDETGIKRTDVILDKANPTVNTEIKFNSDPITK